MSRVELFEKIRRDREFDGLSTHALARRYGVHRRMVRRRLSRRSRRSVSGRRVVRRRRWGRLGSGSIRS